MKYNVGMRTPLADRIPMIVANKEENMRSLQIEGHVLLEDYGINLFHGQENLTRSSNTLHNLEAIERVIEMMNLIKDDGGDLRAMAEVLNDLERETLEFEVK